MRYSSKYLISTLICVIVLIISLGCIVFLYQNTELNPKNKIVNLTRKNVASLVTKIKEDNLTLELVYETTDIPEVISLVFKNNDKYESYLIATKTGKIVNFLDLISDKNKYLKKENELLAAKYPAFITNALNENKDNLGSKVYYVKNNEVIIYYYDYVLPLEYNKTLSLTINFKEIKDLLKITPILADTNTEEQETPNIKYMAFTFDDGPSSTYNAQILKVLQDNQAHATFFMVGYMMEKCPNCVFETYKSGNEIGSHTYDHLNLKNNNFNKINESLTKVNDLYHKITGSTIKYLRPPYGSYNKTNLNNINLPFILWNLDTEDWRYRNKEHIVNYIKDNAQDGAIVLMHELYPETLAALKEILPWLYVNDYRIVSISELAQIKNITINEKEDYYHF